MTAPLIFDLDGTLIDSAHDLGLALNRLLAERGRAAVPDELVRRFIGDGARRLVERGFAIGGSPLAEAETGPAVTRFLDLYAAIPPDPACVYPGVPDTLRRLADAGHPMGLCTNKPAAIARGILDSLGLLRFFGVLVGGDSLPQRKPAPEPLLAVVAGLGRPAGGTVVGGAVAGGAVMVGDGPNDAIAARAAGVRSIIVTYGYPRGNPADLPADRLIDRFAELPQAVAALEGEPPRRPLHKKIHLNEKSSCAVRRSPL